MFDWPELYNDRLIYNCHYFFLDKLLKESNNIDNELIFNLSVKHYLPIETFVHGISSMYFSLGMIDESCNILSSYLKDHDDKIINELYLKALASNPLISTKQLINEIDLYTESFVDNKSNSHRNISETKFNTRVKNIVIMCDFINMDKYLIFYHELFNNLMIRGYTVIVMVIDGILYKTPPGLKYKIVSIPSPDLITLKKYVEAINVDIIIDIIGRFRHSSFLDLYSMTSSIPKLIWNVDFPCYRAPGFFQFTSNTVNLSAEKMKNTPEVTPIKSIATSNLKITSQKVPPFFSNKQGEFIFASFEHLYKINDTVLHSWMNIIKSVPFAKILLNTRGTNTDIFLRRLHLVLEQYDLKPTRIILENECSFNNLISNCDNVDLYLDTFPCTADIQILVPISRGVPSLTMKNDILSLARSCISEEILLELGLENFLAVDANEYVEKAIYYAKNPKELYNERKKLIEKLKLNSTLFNPMSYSIELAHALDNIFNS